MYDKKRLSVQQTVFFIGLSLLMNAFGNGLSIACDLGSAPWTASAANIAVAGHFSIGKVLIVYGFAQMAMNVCLLKRFDFPRLLGNLVFVLFFGSFVGTFSHFFSAIDVQGFSLGVKLALNFLGIFMIAIAISLYQRVNVLLHPIDDMSYILRFKYFHGDSKKSQIVNFLIPVFVIFVTVIWTRKLVAVNVGTLFSFFFMGTMIGWSDQHIFKRLTHRMTFQS